MVYMGGKNSKKRGKKSERFTQDLIPTTKVIEPFEDDYSHPPEIKNFIKNHVWLFHVLCFSKIMNFKLMIIILKKSLSIKLLITKK